MSCGPAALRNALQSRGIHRSEDELARLTGLTIEGTAARGILKAAHMIAVDEPTLRPGVINERRADVAILKLRAAHDLGSAAILCVDNYDHWVASFGMLGDEVFHVADSANDELVLHYTPAALLARWKGPGRQPYYAIIL